MQPVLEINELIVGYDESPVCGPISAKIELGTSIGFIGSNGAGKSSVARTIVGLQRALGGRILFLGQRLDERSPEFRRLVSMVFDEDTFFPWLTVGEHLNLIATGHHVDKSQVARELEFFGLENHANAFPHTLSSGQRRRLLLAAAFIRPAALLVLDEPEQRLDPGMRDRLAKRVRENIDHGQAAIIITHDATLLEDTVDACIFIDTQVRYLTPREGAEAIAA
ncbi:ABC transporter ATP-binding protein (plasmid) [Arthrobacter sp. zg-Y820]|uniref:ABC transporter ATP-binding protein n=1 Tax=unclassified Arthrobacter TaxID=235627 RepID=UPI001E2D072E|nr:MULTISPECIES: ABC transporter ATP-binding protein [unclassified Arthrobacter]MCC9198532.1 ABC transporter ATP-binding protein [Arthrobacter sp. zg-Y820]MDK1281402.1 ABC transporter ATP-binding protein [Arthrobacter sp. zg.Y820]WIB11254.1 ABC transporter ATP-binding protein [Arthrobacter sp. zg-Y820]